MYERCAPTMRDLDWEEFRVLLLNSQHAVLHERLVTRGVLDGARHIAKPHQQLAAAILLQVQPHRRDARRDRRADVHEVGVALRAGPEHRVRKRDRVRLPPGDLVAEPRAQRGLVGGAGPGRDATHGLVGDHLAVGLIGVLGRHRPLAPAVLVDAADVHRRGHRHARSHIDESLGELECGLTLVQRAVDVGLADVEHPAGPLHFGHPHQDPHREAPGVAVIAGE